MITLYTAPMSGNGRKVHMLLEEVGAQYQLSKLDLMKGDQKQSEYLQLNPNGKVPTLVDDDFVLWESNAILVYLIEALGDCALFAREPSRRANILRWLFWEASHWQPMLTRILAARVAQILF